MKLFGKNEDDNFSLFNFVQVRSARAAMSSDFLSVCDSTRKSCQKAIS
jgi:hypothetical protein